MEYLRIKRQRYNRLRYWNKFSLQDGNPHSKNNFYLFRDNYESFTKGAISKKSYEHGNARRMVSLRVSFIGWLCELVGSVISLLTPKLLFTSGISPMYYSDTLIMFVCIPLVYFVNDEEVKGVIKERGWYQGLRYMVGISNKIVPRD